MFPGAYSPWEARRAGQGVIPHEPYSGNVVHNLNDSALVLPFLEPAEALDATAQLGFPAFPSPSIGKWKGIRDAYLAVGLS